MCRTNEGHCDWCGVKLTDAQPEQLSCSRAHTNKMYKRRKKWQQWHRLPCPHPEKISFPVRGLVIRWAYSCGNYYYQCVCGNYHLTSWCDIAYKSSESIENYKNSLPRMRG